MLGETQVAAQVAAIGLDSFLVAGALLFLLMGVWACWYAIQARRLARKLREQEKVSARALAEEREKVAEQAKQLRHLERSKSRFYAAVSHALRTPLTLILGPLEEEIKETRAAGQADRLERLDLMQRNANLLCDRIAELLTLSKADVGELILHVAEQDLVPFLDGIHLSLLGEAERRGVSLEYRPWVEDLCVYFDADLLRKVVASLVTSSLLMTPEGGRVRLCVDRVQADGAELAEIRVKDTGRAIVPAQLSDFVHQLASGNGLDRFSLGFGLALAQPIVEKHGGSIELESEPGFGSTFTVRLPIGSQILSLSGVVGDGSAYSEESTARGDRQQPLLSGENRQPVINDDDEENGPELADASAAVVLVVDDNDEMRRYLREHLQESYCVLEAANGREALELVRTARPALVISDVIMPEMDGNDLCKSIKVDAALRHIPVILLTAHASESGELRGLSAGADDYVTKPFHMDALLARAENLIEIRQRLREGYTEQFVLKPSDVVVNSMEATFLDQVKQAAERHLSDGNFGVEWLADEVGLSARQLQRKLRRICGLTPLGLLRMMRLGRAAQLLEQHAGTVAEVAHQVGYSDAAHFSYVFHQIYGVPPSDFARMRGRHGEGERTGNGSG